jgi:hypothetical protein
MGFAELLLHLWEIDLPPCRPYVRSAEVNSTFYQLFPVPPETNPLPHFPENNISSDIS